MNMYNRCICNVNIYSIEKINTWLCVHITVEVKRIQSSSQKAKKHVPVWTLKLKISISIFKIEFLDMLFWTYLLTEIQSNAFFINYFIQTIYDI